LTSKNLDKSSTLRMFGGRLPHHATCHLECGPAPGRSHLGRGHDELGIDTVPAQHVAVVFTELAHAI
jgi:hypothetical protein